MIAAEAKQDSNNDRTRWNLLDLLVEQISAEHHWIKVKQLFEYQTYFAWYSNNCLSTKLTLHGTAFAATVFNVYQ